MSPIELRSRVGPDGVLELSLPIGPDDANREVKILIEPAPETAPTDTAGQGNWKRFIEETAGSIADPTFVRHQEGQFEARGDLSVGLAS